MCLGIMQERLKARPGYDKALIIDVFEESPSTIAVTEGQPTRVLIGETLVVWLWELQQVRTLPPTKVYTLSRMICFSEKKIR